MLDVCVLLVRKGKKLNKDDIEKVKNRIAQLELEIESNLTEIRSRQIANKSLEGGLFELSSMLKTLVPEKKEEKIDE